VKSRQSWSELYSFEVDRVTDVPLFHQIYLQFRSAILSGALRPATRLPSTRELATRLGVSRSVAIERREREHGVVVRAMSRLYLEKSALMLGFSGYPQQIIAPAIARLARAFER
jgi:DNA-binding transcriptional MocR family regulator